MPSLRYSLPELKDESELDPTPLNEDMDPREDEMLDDLFLPEAM